MENERSLDMANQGLSHELPTLFQNIICKAVAGFDTMTSPPAETLLCDVSEATNLPSPDSPIQVSGHNRMHSISMPSSPSASHMEQVEGILLINKACMSANDWQGNYQADSIAVDTRQLKQAKFHSQPIPSGNSHAKGTSDQDQETVLRNERPNDKWFDSFKTWSGKLERQISNFRGKPLEPQEVAGPEFTEAEAVPAVDRYFDALQGPELDILRPSEELILPEDKKWPFLLRFPLSSFGMCLGVSSQAILWKTIATSPPTSFLHVSLDVNLVLWYISLALMGFVSLIYFLKIIFYFEAVRREYHHPVRVNFFFAPWIACLFLAIGAPPSLAVNLHAALWYVLMTPILCLELKIYGQWMSGGHLRLSKVANPSNHLSIVGNFVGALLGASMGIKEGSIFFFAVGLAHYTVLFVTLYQRLPTNETLPKELHPVFFLFVAAPSVACMAWAKINGNFDLGSRIAYFIALFLYFSLAVRINFFRGFRFSLAWWAYTFPMTGAAIATIRYSAEVRNVLTQSLALALSAISTITVTALLVSTLVHAFVLHDLFPNDISIAITGRRPKARKRRTLLIPTCSGASDIEACVSTEISGH